MVYLKIHKKILRAVLLLMLIGTLGVSSSCGKEDIKSMELSDCSLENFVKSTSDTKGYIWYNSEFQDYALYIGIEGNYDSQDVGVVCNLPDKYKNDGQMLLFSGNFYEYTESVAKKLPGQEFFFIELSRINNPEN